MCIRDRSWYVWRRGEERPIEEQHHDEGQAAERTAAPGRRRPFRCLALVVVLLLDRSLLSAPPNVPEHGISSRSRTTPASACRPRTRSSAAAPSTRICSGGAVTWASIAPGRCSTGRGGKEVVEEALPPVLRGRAVVHRVSRIDGPELRDWHEAREDVDA